MVSNLTKVMVIIKGVEQVTLNRQRYGRAVCSINSGCEHGGVCDLVGKDGVKKERIYVGAHRTGLISNIRRRTLEL